MDFFDGVVLYNDDALSIGKLLVAEFAQHLRIIATSFTFPLFDLTPSQEWCKYAKNGRNPIAFVFAILTGRSSRRVWLKRAYLASELLCAFIQTAQRTLGINRTSINFQHVFHRRDKLSTPGWGDHPLFFSPWFKFILFF